MYFAAAGCAWLLRAWKIGQMEMLAAEKGEDVDAVDPVREEAATVSLTMEGEKKGLEMRSSLVRRLFVVKRV